MRIPTTRSLTVSVSAAALASLLLAGCGATATDATDPAATATTEQTVAATADAATTDAPASSAGAYLSYADYEADPMTAADTTTVLFFHAPWCPSCQATETSLTTDGVPDGLTVVKVDYDSATDLKRTYGITQQHTFVQLGPDGAQQQKWSGSTTGAQIKEKVTT